MSNSAEPVAVTGMAWSTALGDDLDTVWSMMLDGRTGLRPTPHEGSLRNNLVGAVEAVPVDLPADERLERLTSRTAERALASAGYNGHSEAVLAIGTSLAAYLDGESAPSSLYEWAARTASCLHMDAPPVLVSTACSAGSDAIALGAELVRSGAAEVCVCGGADVITPNKRMAHSALGTMSPTFLRAFDSGCDGTLLGEGAAFLVLQRESDAREPLALLRGSGAANDAEGMTAPDATGRSAALALQRSLADAGIDAADIGIINAHGSGTPLNDATERAAFSAVFTDGPSPLVFATKGNFGHSLGATGAIEAVALILALRTGVAPPIVGLEHPDPTFPLPLASPHATRCSARLGLSLTLGFGGFDTSLVFEAAR